MPTLEETGKWIREKERKATKPIQEAAKILITTYTNLSDAEIKNLIAQIETIRGIRDVELLAGRYTITGDHDLGEESHE